MILQVFFCLSIKPTSYELRMPAFLFYIAENVFNSVLYVLKYIHFYKHVMSTLVSHVFKDFICRMCSKNLTVALFSFLKMKNFEQSNPHHIFAC